MQMDNRTVHRVQTYFSSGRMEEIVEETIQAAPPQVFVQQHGGGQMIIIRAAPAEGQQIIFSIGDLLDLQGFSNGNFLEQILLMSEQEQGRIGTPPASEEAIKNL